MDTTTKKRKQWDCHRPGPALLASPTSTALRKCVLSVCFPSPLWSFQLQPMLTFGLLHLHIPIPLCANYSFFSSITGFLCLQTLSPLSSPPPISNFCWQAMPTIKEWMWAGQTEQLGLRFLSSETTRLGEGRGTKFIHLLEADHLFMFHSAHKEGGHKGGEKKKNSLPGYLQVGNWKTGRNVQT